MFYNNYMKFDFSKTKKSVTTTAISLNTVYKLEADCTYDVIKRETEREGYIALRTISGSGNLFIQNHEPKTVYNNTLILFEYAKIDRYYCESDHWDFWWFEFTATDLLSLPLNTLLHIDNIDNELQDCNTCLEMLRSGDDGALGLASATLSLLIYKYTHYYKATQKKIHPYNDSINQVIKLMHHQLGEKISVSKLAKTAKLSERRFRDVFKEITGTSPKKYYDKLRMNMAEAFLNNTSMNLSEIAERLGYSNQFHFSREFKKFYKMSPAQYKKK